MPRKKKPEIESTRLARRRRKFIRKDTQREYQSRAGMILLDNNDGTQTYYKPLDRFMSKPVVADSPKAPCQICGKQTSRVGLTDGDKTVPMCVECGKVHDRTPESTAPVWIPGQPRPWRQETKNVG